MNNNTKRKFLEQKHIPFIGIFKQLLGGAMSWISILTFVFSLVAAWNTETLDIVRSWFPWINLGSFVGIMVICLIFAMWLEHKWIQPSVMAYWNQMQYDQNNPLKNDVLRLEKKIDELAKKGNDSPGNNSIGNDSNSRTPDC